jgi:PPK2 family polyphosphate:nucleotide phosphotransferase
MLIVLQAMDAGGKDGTVKQIGGAMNPQGVKVTSFKKPSQVELDHNFMWRIEQAMPGKGEFGIYNRSYYEDVLIAAVRNLVPENVWKDRFRQINDFEYRHANPELKKEGQGTDIVKFYLHITQEEQWKRFGQRAGDPDKQWKFSGADFAESENWSDYRKAFNRAISKTSTEEAPWIVVPSNHKWYRDLVVSQIVVDHLEAMHMKFPASAVNADEVLKTKFSDKKWSKLVEIFNEARADAAAEGHKQKKHEKPEHLRSLTDKASEAMQMIVSQPAGKLEKILDAHFSGKEAKRFRKLVDEAREQAANKNEPKKHKKDKAAKHKHG